MPAPAPAADDSRPRVAPTRRTAAPTHGTEGREPQWRRPRFESSGQARDRTSQGDGDQRPRKPEMPPPRGPPQRRVIAQEEARLPHTDGGVIRVTGRAAYADELRLPTPIRIRTVVPITGLNNPTRRSLSAVPQSW